MFGAGFDPANPVEWIRLIASVFLTGGVIKLMDDFLDLRYDVFDGVETLAVRLGEGSLPYALMGFAIAVAMHPHAAIALFLGAYAVGMAGDYDRQLPSGLLSVHESLIFLAVGAAFIPWRVLLWGTAAMAAVQLFDDVEDMSRDQMSGNPNIVRRIGVVEGQMLAFACAALAAALHPIGTAAVFASVPAVQWACQRAARPLAKTRGWAR